MKKQVLKNYRLLKALKKNQKTPFKSWKYRTKPPCFRTFKHTY